MRNATAILRNTGLFRGTSDEEISAMCKCLGARSYRYAPGECIFRSGGSVDSMGVVLDGRIDVVKQDWWGNRTVLSSHRAGDVICTEYACSQGESLDASVVAAEQSEVMFFDVARITTTCSSSCEFHARVVRNLVQSLARGSMGLNQRLDQMSKRSTRDKVCAYLSDQARRAGSNEFLIPLNRQEMADHLGVDRSALSAELGRMQRDGIIEFSKNRFVLRQRSPAPVPLGEELLQEPDHVVVAGVRDLAGGRGVHHVPQQEQLLVEVVDGRAPVGEVLGLGHPLPRGLPRHVHVATPGTAVGERPGYADGAYRVEAVGVLDDASLQGVRHLRVPAPERYLGYDAEHAVPHLLRDPLGHHEVAGVRSAGEQLAVVGVVEDRGETDDVLVAPLPGADGACQIVDAHGVPVVVPPAVPLEQPADEIAGAVECPLVHGHRNRGRYLMLPIPLPVGASPRTSPEGSSQVIAKDITAAPAAPHPRTSG